MTTFALLIEIYIPYEIQKFLPSHFLETRERGGVPLSQGIQKIKIRKRNTLFLLVVVSSLITKRQINFFWIYFFSNFYFPDLLTISYFCNIIKLKVCWRNVEEKMLKAINIEKSNVSRKW